eukprot:scpid96933/ scgid21806/ 
MLSADMPAVCRRAPGGCLCLYHSAASTWCCTEHGSKWNHLIAQLLWKIGPNWPTFHCFSSKSQDEIVDTAAAAPVLMPLLEWMWHWLFPRQQLECSCCKAG